MISNNPWKPLIAVAAKKISKNLQLRYQKKFWFYQTPTLFHVAMWTPNDLTFTNSSFCNTFCKTSWEFFILIDFYWNLIDNFIDVDCCWLKNVAQPSIKAFGNERNWFIYVYMFRYSRAMALSQRYNWRDNSEFTMRTPNCVNFIALQNTCQTSNDTS